MTIIYQYRVATTTLGGFLKLLNAWKGSVYKLLYKELLIFLSLYAIISLVYRFALNEEQREVFEGIVLDLYNSSSTIPLSFVLGFYVTFIVQRWWQQFMNVPWPDRTLFTMSAYLHGFDDRGRMMRRSVARYMMFGLIWICRAISVAVMKRFPTLDHIVEAGFITKEEKVMFENTECNYQKFFVPLMWANQVLVTARREGRIESDFGLRMIIEPLADFRDKCSLCFVFDWITVPLVYTQVVTFATYSYFAISLFGQQYLDPSKNYKGFEIDMFVPGFTVLQFLFYMGWLKVAEQMINPFGEDDDDYDINWLLDRHTAVAFALSDQCYGRHPGFVRDGFWNDVAPDVPYTESSARSIRANFLGSTFNIEPSVHENERLLLRDNMGINQHEWGQRHRERSGSILSLFPIRNFLSSGRRGSLATLASTGSGVSRVMPNGKVYYYVLGKEDPDGRIRRSSVDIPVSEAGSESGDELYQVVRDRANTEGEIGGPYGKERKLSLPFTINLFSKSKQKKLDTQPVSGSPKIARFTVEPVKDPPVAESDSGTGVKTRRSGHSSIPYQNVVSRIPMLSAIDEGSTVTSMSQLLQNTQPETVGSDTEDLFDRRHYNEKEYLDDISYVDEGSVKNEETGQPIQVNHPVATTQQTSTTSSPQPRSVSIASTTQTTRPLSTVTTTQSGTSSNTPTTATVATTKTATSAATATNMTTAINAKPHTSSPTRNRTLSTTQLTTTKDKQHFPASAQPTEKSSQAGNLSPVTTSPAPNKDPSRNLGTGPNPALTISNSHKAVPNVELIKTVDINGLQHKTYDSPQYETGSGKSQAPLYTIEDC